MTKQSICSQLASHWYTLPYYIIARYITLIVACVEWLESPLLTYREQVRVQRSSEEVIPDA